MKIRDIVLQSLIHSFLVLIYTTGVAWLLTNAEKMPDHPKSFLAPVAFLLLFVLSATIVACLVLGRPILLYVEGQKKESLYFLGATIAWLFAFTFFFFFIF